MNSCCERVAAELHDAQVRLDEQTKMTAKAEAALERAERGRALAIARIEESQTRAGAALREAQRLRGSVEQVVRHYEPKGYLADAPDVLRDVVGALDDAGPATGDA